MSPVVTLTELLESIGVQLQIYDMGRRVRELPRTEFLKFERTEKPYPLPLLRQAWLGLLSYETSAGAAEPSIWFIRFPLDEQGKLLLAARDDFLHRLLEQICEGQPAAAKDERLQAAMQDNPYGFRPQPERLAVFHAQATLTLQQPPSRFYEHARAYFNGELGWDQWSFLGYQGIADIAVRLEWDDNIQRLSGAIPHLPPAPLEALCHCLENQALPTEIARPLLQRATDTLSETAPDLQILTACIRGISQAVSSQLRDALIGQVLAHECAGRSDILAAIGGRAWEVLVDERIRSRFLERLAVNERGQAFFASTLSELLFLPDTRSFMLASLKTPHLPEPLDRAIKAFLASLRKSSA